MAIHQYQGVGVFTDRDNVQQVLNELESSGFSMDKVSVIAKQADQEGQQLDGAEVKDHIGDQEVGKATSVTREATSTAFWGSVLVGLSSLAVPGVGPVLAAGALGVSLITGVAGAGLGAIASGQLTQALTNIGIPADQAERYGDRLQQGDFLLFISGTEDEIRGVASVLTKGGIQQWNIYEAQQVQIS